MTDEDIRELLREMRDEPVPPDSLLRVRQGVAEKRRNRAYGKTVAALAAAAGLLLGAWLLRPGTPAARETPAPALGARQQAEAVSPATVPIEARTVVRVAKKAPRRAAPLARPAKPPQAMIRIENDDDPDVLILLLD